MAFWNRKPKPEAAIGPDGMTDCAREMRRQWRVRDEAVAKIQAAVSERTGIPAEAFDYMPHEYLTLAILLNVGDGAASKLEAE